MEKIRFGVNYIPSKNWLHSWINWDAESVRKDLTSVKNLGLDHIRLHLMWNYFQIDATVMSPDCMEHLNELCDICEELGLDYCVTLFNGFVSGQYFYPAWMQNYTGAFGKGMFHNEKVMQAQEFYIKSIAKIVADKPHFLGFDLGNELPIIIVQDHTVTRAQCDAWAKRMLSLCEELAPGKLHNNGVDGMPWFDNWGFSMENLANEGAVTVLHCYIRFVQGLKRFGRLSDECINLAPFMMEIAKAFANDNSRSIWIQEFGTAEDFFDDEIVEFISKSMYAMYAEDHLWGITWWSSHNVDKQFSNFDKLEYSLGLFDNDNNITPSGELYKKLMEEYKNGDFKAPKRTKAIIFDPYDENGKATIDNTWKYGKRYAELAKSGEYVALVLPHKANDTEYLKSRGIEEIIE